MNFSFATNVASKYSRCTSENQTMVAPCSSISLWHRSPMGNSQTGYVDEPMAHPETLNRYIGASGTIQSPPAGHVRGPFLFIPGKRLGGSSFSRLNRTHRLEQFVHTHRLLLSCIDFIPVSLRDVRKNECTMGLVEDVLGEARRLGRTALIFLKLWWVSYTCSP